MSTNAARNADVAPQPGGEVALASGSNALREVQQDLQRPVSTDTARFGLPPKAGPAEDLQKAAVGNIVMRPDGTTIVNYDPTKRADKLVSLETSPNPNNRESSFSTRTFQGREDGLLTEKSILNGKRQETGRESTFDPAKRPDGLKSEVSALTADGNQITRQFDPAKNPRGLASEVTTGNTRTKTTTTERRFENNKEGLISETVVSDGNGNSKVTGQFRDGSRIEVTRENGRETTKRFDKDGKEIKGDTPATNADGTPKSIDQQLQEYRQQLEQRNSLPALQRGNGPFQSVEAAVKAGQLPKMSVQDMVKEARRIRDRDNKDKPHVYKVGEKPEFYSKAEMDKMVEAKRKELEAAQPTPPPRPPETETTATNPTPPRPPDTETETRPPTPAPVDKTNTGDQTKIQVQPQGATPEFASQVQRAIDSLPEGARKALKEAGVSIVAANAIPEQTAQQRDTWLNSNSFFDPAKKALVIADTTDTTAGSAGSRIGMALGKLLDSNLRISDSPEFEEAIRKDLQNPDMEPILKMLAETSLINPPNGKATLFGSVFGEIYAPGVDTSRSQLTRHLPNVIALIRSRMEPKK